jgi:hypothetical protein
MNIMDFYIIIISITVCLVFILSNMYILSVIISYLGIKTNEFFPYLFVRVSLLPCMIYIIYIVIRVIINCFTDKKKNINYNIFNENMYRPLTIYRLLYIIIFISLGFCVRLTHSLYFVPKETKIEHKDILLELKNVNLGSKNLNLSNIDLSDSTINSKINRGN